MSDFLRPTRILELRLTRLLGGREWQRVAEGSRVLQPPERAVGTTPAQQLDEQLLSASPGLPQNAPPRVSICTLASRLIHSTHRIILRDSRHPLSTHSKRGPLFLFLSLLAMCSPPPGHAQASIHVVNIPLCCLTWRSLVIRLKQPTLLDDMQVRPVGSLVRGMSRAMSDQLVMPAGSKLITTLVTLLSPLSSYIFLNLQSSKISQDTQFRLRIRTDYHWQVLCHDCTTHSRSRSPL